MAIRLAYIPRVGDNLAHTLDICRASVSVRIVSVCERIREEVFSGMDQNLAGFHSDVQKLAQSIETLELISLDPAHFIHPSNEEVSLDLLTCAFKIQELGRCFLENSVFRDGYEAMQTPDGKTWSEEELAELECVAKSLLSYSEAVHEELQELAFKEVLLPFREEGEEGDVVEGGIFDCFTGWLHRLGVV